MAEEEKQPTSNHLTAKDLLKTRGIRALAYDEYARSSLVLPKTGEKFFEPNGSWLQEKQISTNLENRRDLLKIERVNRLSQLAVAEWLPNERRAIVTKRSGLDWYNYGHELNKNLYLIPEEALLLVELNCLELMWNGLPLSVQQAYELLLDSPHSDVTLSEYRVYSHLARLGYRLQRFFYDKSPERGESSSHPKKKVIVVPENGKWMGETGSRSDQKPEKIDEAVKETIQTIIDDVTAVEEITNGSSRDPDKNKAKSARLEIVSEETVVEPIKLIRPQNSSDSSPNQTPKWTAARIQRNVKQLPKRNDNKRRNSIQTSPDKKSGEPSDSPQPKKVKHEVIELSDDDIQEIPRVPSRMDILNQFPNIASSELIKITKDYIPPNINPQKSVYQCDRKHLEVVQETDRRYRSTAKTRRALLPTPYVNRRNPAFRDHRSYAADGYYRTNSYQNGQFGAFSISNRFYQNSQFFPGGSWVQHRMVENVVMNQTNRWSSYQVNVFRNSLTLGYTMGAAIVQNSLNMYNNFMWQAQNFFRGRRYDPRGYRQPPRPPTAPQRPISDSYLYQSSFTKVPASSWSEIKQKWRDAKAITIDDEEDKMDCSEVEVVEENIQPLVGARHADSLGEIFARLRIIKPAPEKTVRKKKGDYKISYKVYPNNNVPFKKSNPGPPMFHVVVTRYSKTFQHPVELNRLQQDGNGVSVVFALVSGYSIVYLQTGLVNLPNLANDYQSN